ncbi:MAG TPA: hypothetical protein VFV52_07240 [Bacilli bacterium]|nr:hypothetical protein [Bacilli bacterium]
MRPKIKSEVSRLLERRSVRLKSKWITKSKERRIRSVESAWRRYAVGDISLNDLLQMKTIVELIRSRARKNGEKWRNIRLCEADFESCFWGEAWNVIADYTWHSGYYLYETLDLAFSRRALDLVRAALRKKRAIWSKSLPLADDFENFWPDEFVNIESEVTDQMVVDEMIGYWSLTNAERQLLVALLDDPEASLQELADRCGLPNKMSVSRMKDRLKQKLALYNPYKGHLRHSEEETIAS